MNWRKLFSFAAAGAICAGFLPGCTSPAKNSSKTGGSSKVTIQVAVSGSAQEIAVHQQKFDLYTSKHPNIKIQPINIGDDRVQKTLTLISAGSAPDILYVNEYTYVFAAKGVLHPLDDQIKRDSFDISTFNESLLVPLRYQGKLYALPQEVSPFVIYYNKDMFQAAGLPFPTDKWTIDEFYTDAKKLTNPSKKVYGYRQPTNWPDQILGWLSRGGVDFDISGKTVDSSLNTPQTLKVLQFLHTMVAVDKVSPNPAELTAMGKGADVVFRNQKVAMESQGLWMLPQYKAEPLAFQWDIVRVPKDQNQRTKAGILNWAISTSSHNMDAAWDLLKFMVGPDGMKIVAKNNMALPASKDTAANQIVLDSKFPPNVKAFIDSVPDVDLRDERSTVRDQVNTEINDEVERMLLNKESPEDTQKALVQKIDAILAQAQSK